MDSFSPVSKTVVWIDYVYILLNRMLNRLFVLSALGSQAHNWSPTHPGHGEMSTRVTSVSFGECASDFLLSRQQ